MSPANFDSIARPYRWLEYLSFGPMLERCRFYWLPQLKEARRALVLGDGDGRFLARLLAANPQIEADVVDLSPAMLRLLTRQVELADAADRVTVHCIDARQFEPEGSYDLVVTHFFLDCFTTEELYGLASRIQQHLAPGARWVVSEFAIPGGWASFPARFVILGLYAAFDLLTGLRLTQLPDYASAFHSAGLERRNRRTWLGGLLVSEIWEVAPLSS
jgi:SAM-dependent methyltransferase